VLVGQGPATQRANPSFVAKTHLQIHLICPPLNAVKRAYRDRCFLVDDKLSELRLSSPFSVSRLASTFPFHLLFGPTLHLEPSTSQNPFSCSFSARGSSRVESHFISSTLLGYDNIPWGDGLKRFSSSIFSRGVHLHPLRASQRFGPIYLFRITWVLFILIEIGFTNSRAGKGRCSLSSVLLLYWFTAIFLSVPIFSFLEGFFDREEDSLRAFFSRTPVSCPGVSCQPRSD